MNLGVRGLRRVKADNGDSTRRENLVVNAKVRLHSLASHVFDEYGRTIAFVAWPGRGARNFRVEIGATEKG